MSKLSLDRDKIDQAKMLAEQIVSPVHHFIERHSTVSIERSVLRLLGVKGSVEEKPRHDAPEGHFPLVNALLDKISEQNLGKGSAYWFGLAVAHHPRYEPSELARHIVSGKIRLGDLEALPLEKIDIACQQLLSRQLNTLREVREHKNRRIPLRRKSQPLRYVIVATGNIHEDIIQARAAAEMGADIIAVIRSTAQSLLDYVPEGETREGHGGTFATQENFRLMRRALDEFERQLNRRIGLTNYSSGLCMAEIAVIGALEGVDYLLNDAMYGILFRDINMRRNFVDQHFSRRICALSGITIQTGEDNYLTTAESFKYWYQVLASHFINQAFAKKAGLGDAFLSLGHAFEMDPSIEDSVLYEWGQAQLVREVFPRSPIKFMPPTKHKSGDIFFSYLYDGMFNLAGVLTGQTIQLLGMHTEAVHNPFIQDRFLSLKNANYIFNAAKSTRDEILFQPNGKIARRARQVLDDATRFLKKVKSVGLFHAIEDGAFANVRRRESGGKGMEGVFHKDRDYYTPLQHYLTPKAFREEARGEATQGRRARSRPAVPGRRQARSGTAPAKGKRRPAVAANLRGKGKPPSTSRPRKVQELRGKDRENRGAAKKPLRHRELNGKNSGSQGAGLSRKARPEEGRRVKPPKEGASKEKVILLPSPEDRVAQEVAFQKAFHQQQINKKKGLPSGEATLPRRPLPRRPLRVNEQGKEEAKEEKKPSEKVPPRFSTPPLPRRPLKTKEETENKEENNSTDE